MRTLLVIAVIALFVDAFFYSGAFTQAAYANVVIAADRFVAWISDAVEIGGREGST